MFSRSIVSNVLRQTSRPAVRAPLQPFRATFSPLTPFQARLLSDATRKSIENAIASAPVVLFMKGTPETPQCGFSRNAIAILSAQAVDPEKFAAFNVLEDPELREGIKEYTNWPTIPQLYLNKEFVGGSDILVQMYQSGDLTKLFEDANVVVSSKDQTDE